MARTASDKRKSLKGIHAYWQAMKDRKDAFTVSDIVGATQGDRSTVAGYVRSLVKAGYLELLFEQPHSHGGTPAKVFKIARKSYYAPKVRRDGSEVPPTANDHLWRSMKMIKTFTAEELAYAAETPTVSVSVETARDYCKHLKAAGYMNEIKPGKTTGGRATFRFLNTKNTGPLAPEIQRVKQVFDPNLGEVMHREDPNE